MQIFVGIDDMGYAMEQLPKKVQKLKPDLILCTGDMTDGENDVAISLCKELAAIAPAYYIYGNNEVEKYYDVPLEQEDLDEKFGFDNDSRDPAKLLEATDELTQALEEVGVKVLKNAYDTVTIDKTKVDIYGVLTSNPSAFWSYAGKSFSDYLYFDQDHLKITAIHEPVVFEVYEPESWGDLVLAGHNHGGLVKIPIIGPLYTLEGGLLPARKGCYVSGRYEVQGRPLIVSAGLENKNVFRINNQPELVIVDINKF